MSQIYNPPPVPINTDGNVNFVTKVTKVAVAYPVISLGTKAITVPVPGVLASDFAIAVLNATNALALGLSIGGCRVVSDGAVEVTFVTPLALGVALGSLYLDFLILGTR